MIISLLTWGFTACDQTSDLESATDLPLQLLKVSSQSNSEGTTTFITENICPVFEVTNPLTADEIEFLYAAREDEKLARDLYSVYAAQYPAYLAFKNIAAAESNHIAAIEKIFGYYEIEFPELTETGVFADAGLQEKYDSLVPAATPLEAFTIMAYIEEEGIYAYQAVIETTENANIKLFLENMVKASSNHLKAAVRQITLLEGTYTPSILDQAAYDEIINSSFGKGNMYLHKYGRGGKNALTNSEKGDNGRGRKGGVDHTGTCTETANGAAPGTSNTRGSAGKGYRGGK